MKIATFNINDVTKRLANRVDKQVPDFIALRGDPSDNLPGAPGVGATRAATLCRYLINIECPLMAQTGDANSYAECLP